MSGEVKAATHLSATKDDVEIDKADKRGEWQGRRYNTLEIIFIEWKHCGTPLLLMFHRLTLLPTHEFPLDHAMLNQDYSAKCIRYFNVYLIKHIMFMNL